ncbi:acetyltransferase, GNAT family [Dendryphion nanum]|uniref:Acetyltransferase, GNAT family n=1 Tax=Dendryphion nanum TaxID=256645 RepID=A0A9P9DXN4_9PLEO|nr:acetyltransferase, GNAT family [Dendryphion nanum]
MDQSQYILLQRLPTPQEYHDLRRDANLTPPPMEFIPKALAGSFACFTIFERKHMVDDTTPGGDQHPVAMGRLLGDGSLFLQLCDVAVHPEHQGKGLGKCIMKALTDYVDENAPQAYVSLVAEPVAQGLYPKYGFEDVKPSIGMYRCRWIQDNPEFQEKRKAKAAALMHKERPSRPE